MEILIDAGADVNSTDKSMWTGLMWAAFRGFCQHSKLFLSSLGENLIAFRSFIFHSIASGHAVIAEMLIKKGADIHLRNDNGHTARNLAYFRGMT